MVPVSKAFSGEPLEFEEPLDDEQIMKNLTVTRI